jgi:gliding motility-associated-like protein
MRKILRGHVFTKSLFILCLGLSFLVEVHAQVSGTFTINSAAATSGSNFNSFSAAAAFLSGGVNGPVVFNVDASSGPYNEQVILNTITGTSATNTITFNCNGVTLQFLSTNSNQRAGIKLNNADYVTFDNLTVEAQAVNAGEYGYGFHLINDADNNTIKNCRITTYVDLGTYQSFEGIVINGNDGNSLDPGYSFCDNNLIQDNVITGGSVGISLSSIPNTGNPAQFMTGNRVVGNTISNAILRGMQINYNSGTVIDRNEIMGGPDAIYGNYGMYITSYNQSLSITRNKIHGFQDQFGLSIYGIYISSESVLGKECLIANNLIYDFQGDGSQYGIASRNIVNTYSGSYLNVYHNTISLDDQNVFGIESYALYFEKVTNVDVADNIITITRAANDYNIGINLDSIPVNFTASRNDYYIPNGSASICAVGKYNGTTYSTLLEWQTVTGYEIYSRDIDPVYTNLTGFNFKPTSQSLDNMGMNVSVNIDIDNITRSTLSPDVGCYEFTSANCTTPVTAGTATVLPDSILCSGPQVLLNLQGNSAGGGQTYTWQTSTTATGTYTNLSGALGYPAFQTTPTTTLYYRVAVTCGATTAFSSPKRILVNTTLNPGTYTINNALPTGGINFNSFTDAVLALQCGINGNIVFNVASGSGPYNEQVIIPAVTTSATKTITFNCNGVTMAYAPNQTSQRAVFKLDGADYITIDSLNVDVQGATYGFGIHLMNDADHNTIKRCTINLDKTTVTSTYAGIVISPTGSDPIDYTRNSYCDSNLVANNTVNGGFYGITCASNSIFITAVSQSIGNILRNNTLSDNAGYGVFVSGTAKTLVDSNDISHPTRTTIASTGFVGIIAYQANYGLTISRNKIHNLLEKATSSVLQLEGIRIDKDSLRGTDPNYVTNNLLYNFKGNGLQHGLYAIFSYNVKFYHNTVALDDTTAKTTRETRGIGLFGSLTTGVEFKDNNIVVRRGGTGPKYCVYLNLNDINAVSNYNNFYLSAVSGTTNYTGFMNGVNYATLSNWLATGKDSSSISIDPVYFDPANGDLTPTKIAFENRGSYIGVAKDIYDAARNTTIPDIGAIEFTICRPLTTPVLSIDSGGINALKFGWTAVQNTTGYRVSRDGITWTIPSSGAFGTSHTITGLKPTDTIGLMVKALGTRVDCPEYFSQRLVGQALADGIFIPNTFTPNGNGQDDAFKVYTNVMSSMHWMVFNQWGEKVFETSDKNGQWDGSYKGKPQPIGVYIYVVVGTLADGTKVTKKGSFNLIR